MISEIFEVEVPVHGYGFQPAFVSRLRASPPPTNLKTFREEVKGLSRGVDNILVRIENLGQGNKIEREREGSLIFIRLFPYEDN